MNLNPTIDPVACNTFNTYNACDDDTERQRASRVRRRVAGTALGAALALTIGTVSSAATAIAAPVAPVPTPRPATTRASAPLVTRSAAEKESRIRQRLDELVAAGVPAGVVYTRDGSRVTTVAVGPRDITSNTVVSPSDRYRIGSVTKTYVATVVLQLVDENKLTLDDTVEKWLPGVVPNGAGIHLRQLLNMTAGLFDYLNDDTTISREFEAGNLTRAWTPRELVALSTAHAPKFAPGKGWHYCNTCYVLAGLIVEKATGHTFESELRKRILEPLDLRQTTFDAQPRIRGSFAHGYELVNGKPVDVSILNPSAAWAAGAIVADAADTDRFLRALLSGKLLSPASLHAMRTFVASDGQRYGLGLAAIETPCGDAWGNIGGIPGYHTFAISNTNASRSAMVFVSLGESSTSEKANNALQLLVATAFCG